MDMVMTVQVKVLPPFFLLLVIHVLLFTLVRGVGVSETSDAGEVGSGSWDMDWGCGEKGTNQCLLS
jgi:hypothetical protein